MASLRVPLLSLTIVVALSAAAARAVRSQTVPDAGFRGAPVGLVTVLDGARLRADGLQTLADALRSVPGLGVLETGAFGGGTATLAADGGSAADVVVRWDGVPLGIGDGPVDLSHVTLDGVERIEVRRGAAADLAGGGSSGAVVDVVTRSTVSRPMLAFDALAGGDRTSLGRADAAAGLGPMAGSVGGSALGTDGGIIAGERYSLRAVAGSIRLSLWGGGWLRFSGRRSDARYDFPSSDIGYAPPPGAVLPGLAKVQHTNLETLALQAGFTLGRRLSAYASIGRDRRDGRFAWEDFDSVNNVPLVEVWRKQSSRTHAVASARLRVTHWLEVTLQYAYDRGAAASVDTVRNDVDPSAPAWRVWNWYRQQRRWRDGAWRGEIAARRGPFAFEGGLRPDSWRGSGTALTWRALASWTSRAGTVVHVGGRSAFRAPGLSDDIGGGPNFALQADPSLRLQRSRTLEAGVSQRFLDGRLSVAATVIEQRFTDYVAVVPVAAGPTFPEWVLANVGTARARGIDLMLRARPSRALVVEAALAHLPARALPGSLPVGGSEFVPGEALVGRPDDIATLGVEFTIGGGGVLDARLRHVSGRSGLHYALGQVRDTLPAFTTVDVGGTIPVRSPAAIMFRVENLFGARYVDGLATAQQLRGGYPVAGRRAVVGMRLALP